jgi:predicted transglutaminase-like cysteine proteinase
MLLRRCAVYQRQRDALRPPNGANPEHALTGRSGASSNRVSLFTVNRWMTELRNVPYAYHRVWQTPGQVHSGAATDCKGKAVAPYRRMKANGAGNLRLVIGRPTTWSGTTHAWLEWNTARRNYVLDPTFHTHAILSQKLGNHSYLPLYAYAGAKKFRARRLACRDVTATNSEISATPDRDVNSP